MSRYLALAALLAATACASKTERAPGETAAPLQCGEDDQPDCPLQELMNARLTPELRSARLEQLAESLTLVAASAPAGYERWTPLARAGASAAARGDADAAKASCGKCHDLYRKRYRIEFRSRPIAGASH
jgi:hypothetical protein